MTTPNKIAANRLNALKSTGPKTELGKNRSKMNSLKHGLLAKEVVVSVGEASDDRNAFVELLEALIEEKRPVGILEEMQVERIAICYWRLGRCLRAESGEIGKISAGISNEFHRDISESVEKVKKRSYLENTLREYEKSSLGLKHVIHVLEQARDQIEVEFDLNDKMLEKLLSIYGAEERSLPILLKSFCLLRQRAQVEAETNPEATPQKQKKDPYIKIMLETIAKEIKRCNDGLEQVSKIEETRLKSNIRSSSLPAADTIDKLIRYETAIESKYYKAINELERMQRQRKGDLVPPPLKLGVTVEH